VAPDVSGEQEKHFQMSVDGVLLHLYFFSVSSEKMSNAGPPLKSSGRLTAEMGSLAEDVVILSDCRSSCSRATNANPKHNRTTYGVY
jgi:hypothetical protein